MELKFKFETFYRLIDGIYSFIADFIPRVLELHFGEPLCEQFIPLDLVAQQ